MDKVSDITKKLLINRQLISHISTLTAPQKTDLPAVESVSTMSSTAQWFLEQITGRKPILIFGDYDVDGISASAILSKYFTSLGCKSTIFIPSRLTDGYGLKLETITKLNISQYEAIIVVDSGTNSEDVHQYIEQLAIPTVILDHHTKSINLREYKHLKIVNPRINNEFYACSATLAYLFVMSCSPELSNEYIGPAAMASITDSVPISLENHTIIKYGLTHMSKWIGLKVMLQELEIGFPTQTAIGWRIGPRLNAPGRLGNATTALDLLLSTTEADAKAVLAELEACNSKRKDIQDKILKEATKLAETQADKGAILVSGDWHIGVLGIVAAKLSETFNVPAIVTTATNPANGSGRAPDGYDLVQLLSDTSLPRTCFGGHARAIGVHIPAPSMQNVTKEFQATATNCKPGSKQAAHELEITTKNVNQKEAYAIECLEPFGEEFPEPIFGIKGKIIEEGNTASIEDEFGKCSITGKKHTCISSIIPVKIKYTYFGSQVEIV